MKIEIHGLGAIKTATIDLKPLTTLIGPNNAGKTWLAYVLVAIFGPNGWEHYSKAYARGKLLRSYPLLDFAIEKILSENNTTIDLYEFAKEDGEKYFQNVADFARTWLDSFMSSEFQNFSNMKFSLELADTKAAFLEEVEKFAYQSDSGGLFTIRKKRGDKTLYAFTSTSSEEEEQAEGKIPKEEIKERLTSAVFRILHRSLYPNVHVFPTERTTFVTFPFGKQTSRKSAPPVDQKTMDVLGALQKSLQELQELVGLDLESRVEETSKFVTGPVGNFVSMMGAAFKTGPKQIERRLTKAKADQRIQKYIDLSEVLEKNILCGGLDFSTPEPDPRRDILFQATPDIKLELPIVSSMVKELAPLVIYLRYIAEPGELLVIDEPEMNLHPAAQIQIIEFLAMLVNAGLHILITTHSTFVIDHLANLMEAHKHKNQDVIAEGFLLEQKEAFISQDKVSVYFVGGGEVKNILDPAGAIDWKTFSDVTALVERIHFELLGE